MIGHLYRYPHPLIEGRWIYVGQGPKRDKRMKLLTVTNQNFIVCNGGGSHANSGHFSHYPIFIDAEGNEYLYTDGQRPIEIGQTGLIGQRQVVNRG